jgi:hypothetical protein
MTAMWPLTGHSAPVCEGSGQERTSIPHVSARRTSPIHPCIRGRPRRRCSRRRTAAGRRRRDRRGDWRSPAKPRHCGGLSALVAAGAMSPAASTAASVHLIGALARSGGANGFGGVIAIEHPWSWFVASQDSSLLFVQSARPRRTAIKAVLTKLDRDRGWPTPFARTDMIPQTSGNEIFARRRAR